MPGASAAVVDRGRQLGTAWAERGEASGAELFEVAGVVAWMSHPLVQPTGSPLGRRRTRVPVGVERVVAIVVALDGRRMCAPGQVDDGGHQEPGQERPVGIAPYHVRLDELFRHQNHGPTGLAGRRADARGTPRMAVSVG